MTKSAEQIVNEINALAQDVVVESNDGTHGLDPQWHTWWTYERLDGSRYTVGRKGAGYVRHHTHLRPAARREQIAALQSLLRTVQSEAEMRARRIDNLNSGWDGAQFIGVEAGREESTA